MVYNVLSKGNGRSPRRPVIKETKMTALEAIEEVTKLRMKRRRVRTHGSKGYWVSSEDFKLVVSLTDLGKLIVTRNAVLRDLDAMTVYIFDADIHGYEVGEVTYQARKKTIRVHMIRASSEWRE